MRRCSFTGVSTISTTSAAPYFGGGGALALRSTATAGGGAPWTLAILRKNVESVSSLMNNRSLKMIPYL